MEEAVETSELQVSPIEDYSQYFFEHEDGAVTGYFVIHLPNSDDWRDVVKESCAKHRISEYPCNQNDYGVVDAGERKWVPSKIDLPATMGGGCMIVKVRTSASRTRIFSPECNGPN